MVVTSIGGRKNGQHLKIPSFIVKKWPTKTATKSWRLLLYFLFLLSQSLYPFPLVSHYLLLFHDHEHSGAPKQPTKWGYRHIYIYICIYIYILPYIYIHTHGVRPICRLHFDQKFHFPSFIVKYAPKMYLKTRNFWIFWGVLFLFNQNNKTNNKNDRISQSPMSKKCPRTGEMLKMLKISRNF